MADVAVDASNPNPKELYGQGVRAYVLQDYEAAVKALGRASEIMVAQLQDELHDSLGDVYLYYGKSLLELSRKEGTPFGEAVMKTVEEGEEEDSEDDEEEVRESEAKNGGQEKKEEEEEVKAKNGDEAGPSSAGAGGAGSAEGVEGSSTEEPKGEDEDLTDLQVAWEVLELSKKIFTARGAPGKKHLADTLIVLGEVSLESGNFPSAIEDMSQGLDMQKTVFGNDSRTIAETLYKLGGAFSMNAQMDEAIASFTSCLVYLKNKINSLGKDEEGEKLNADEIKELGELIPEIEEKITDMQNLKAELASKMTVAMAAAETNGSGQSSSSTTPSKPATDISHLVKRKRKSEPEGETPPQAKRPTP